MKTLEEIKGIGPKNRKLLNKLGIYNTNDLIQFYPFRYEILEKTDLNHLEEKEKIVIDGMVENVPRVYYISRKLDKMSFSLNTGSNVYQIVIFNRGFLKSKLAVGTGITIIGVIDKKHHTITASDIRFGKIVGTQIEPIYHSTYGLSGSTIHKYILEALKEQPEIPDYIPKEISEQYHFWDKKRSMIELHHPISKERLKCASVRMKYEELFIFMLKMNYLKNNKENKIGLERTIDFQKVTDFMENLPFSLTVDQKKSIEDIYHDLCDKKRMNRLLQGDVGSGKTIVAIISMYMNYLSGYQSALMAPTEILAIQHYQNMQKLFSPFSIKIGLLTGKLKAKEKKQLLEDLKTDILDLPMGYVRGGAKSHGRNNRIEGVVKEGMKVVVVEDLISTGGSSLECVEALREAGCEVLGLIAIFTYGLDKATVNFENAHCPFVTLSNYDTLIEVAKEHDYIKHEDMEKLKAWKVDPSDESWMNK